MPKGATVGLQEAADQLGLHYMTVYRYLRQGRLDATRDGNQWRVRTADLAALQPGRGSERRGAGRRLQDRRALARLMLRGDLSGSWWLIESHLGGGSDPSGILVDFIVPALSDIGERWASGDVTVAEEHRATCVAERLLGRLSLSFGRRGPRRGAVVLASPATDLHSLPVAIAADLARLQGYDVHELGANTPPDALAEAVRTHQDLIAVGLASTTAGQSDEVAAAVAAVHAVTSAPVLLGGRAITDESMVRELGADVWTGPGPTAFVDALGRVTAAEFA